MRKYSMLLIVLIVGVLFASCKEINNQDLFKEQDNSGKAEQVISDEVTSTAGNQETTITVKPVTPTLPEKSDHNSKGDSMEISAKDLSDRFYYEKLSDEVKERIQGKSYKDNCDVPYDELRYVSVLYWGFDGETHQGELIVNKSIAEDTVDIFKELYNEKYPIERMVLVDEYDADDNTSMAANNTSCFNYRNVDGTKHLSLHSYGLAIDINPLYNPYVRTMDGKKIITPENGKEYADRSLNCSYYINTEDPCYKAFIKRGFTWGGAWNDSKDYQHFQKKAD